MQSSQLGKMQVNDYILDLYHSYAPKPHSYAPELPSTDAQCLKWAKKGTRGHNSWSTSLNNMGSSQLHPKWPEYFTVKKWIVSKNRNHVFLLLFTISSSPPSSERPPCVLASSVNK